MLAINVAIALNTHIILYNIMYLVIFIIYKLYSYTYHRLYNIFGKALRSRKVHNSAFCSQ